MMQKDFDQGEHVGIEKRAGDAQRRKAEAEGGEDSGIEAGGTTVDLAGGFVFVEDGFDADEFAVVGGVGVGGVEGAAVVVARYGCAVCITTIIAVAIVIAANISSHEGGAAHRVIVALNGKYGICIRTVHLLSKKGHALLLVLLFAA
mmetsp:Transcript_20793/g.43816  ORF Transcript_20793/g.43816 Transcript_20793/m.43816 type:complete len:147 (-) Transcript_20793:50-490(-)